MKNPDQRTKLGRRNFLLVAGAGSAGVAATLIATKAGQSDQASEAAPGQAQPKGYRLSEHIAKYYKTTLI